MQIWPSAALVAGLAACGGPDPASHESGRPQPVIRTLEATIDAAYFTAWEENGKMQFRGDRYGLQRTHRAAGS